MNSSVLKFVCLHVMLMILCQFTNNVFAQWTRIPKSQMGVGGFHNFQTESQAIEVRYKQFITPVISVTPRFSYYLPGNPIIEYYAGIDMNYHFNMNRKLQPYVFAGGYYNRWINFEQYGVSVKKKNNLLAELGCGMVLNIGCRLKPYVEWRYNTQWKEGSIGAGFLISFAKCPGRGLASKCPAYH